ncbi:C1q-related factor-like [Pecten maximus]|uniref:C1q-related factor-like n=1 Tax=Pecten maximus TaxID=6579 RepID=UPI001458CA00|nr:C1q-related factor-like [Pecten maximus]
MSFLWVMLLMGMIYNAIAQDPTLEPHTLEIFRRLDRDDKLISEMAKTIAELREDNRGLKRKFDMMWKFYTRDLNNKRVTDDEDNTPQQFTGDDANNTSSRGKLTVVDRVSPSFAPTTAFFAILGSDLIDPSENYVIPFHNVVTNIGGNFNTHGTGVFLCEIPGTYVFQWTICVRGHQMAFGVLVKNGSPISTVTSGRDEIEYSSGTGSAIIELDPGDDVVLEVKDPRNSADISGGFTTFSGFLLK